MSAWQETVDAAATVAIEVSELRVDYGETVAVQDLSVKVPQGEIFGLIGPNGAGKTSTIKVLATLLEPTYGEVRLAGLDVLEATEQVREILGYMPDLAPVPQDLRLWEFLAFHAETHRLGNRSRRLERVHECLEEVKLFGKRDAWCRDLSRGQTQRLVLAKTLLHRPKVLVLDEPASGLDALSRRELRLTLQGLVAHGATVLISSHVLSDLAETCTSMCVMNRGELLSVGPVADVYKELASTERALVITVLTEPEAARHWLEAREGVGEIRTEGSRIIFGFAGSDDEQAELLRELAAADLRLSSFAEAPGSFEDILLRVAEGNRET